MRPISFLDLIFWRINPSRASVASVTNLMVFLNCLCMTKIVWHYYWIFKKFQYLFFGERHGHWWLRKNACLPVNESFPKNPKRAIYLSRKLVQLLGWDLPKSKIPFLTQDGSAKIHEVAKYFGISVDDVKDAAFPVGKNGEGRIKEKVIMYELISYGNTEIQISALGGHGFPVFTPQVIV